jgi:hypothetical protein
MSLLRTLRRGQTVALMVVTTACGGNETGPNGGENPPDVFTVTAVTPTGAASDPWPSVTVALSAAAEPASVTPVTLRVLEGTAPLPARIVRASDGKSVALEAPFLPGHTYRVEATAGITSTTGIALTAAQAAFTTRSLQSVATQAGQFVRQALLQDGTGHLHLMTHDATAGLIYSTCGAECGVAASWQRLELGTQPDFMLDIGFAVDGAGRPHVTYHEAGGLRYGSCDAGCTTTDNWHLATLDGDAKAGMWSRLKVDQSGALHVVQSNWTDGRLRYHHCSSNCGSEVSWAAADLPDPILDMQDVALALTDGRVHVVYRGSTGNTYPIRYATCTSGCLSTAGWETGLLTTPSMSGSGSALAALQTGALAHAYINGSSQLVVATCASGCTTASAWSPVTIDPAANSVLVDVVARGDRMGVAYGVNGTLRLATCAHACTSAAGWKIGLVNSTGMPTPSLLLDPAGQPRMATAQAGGQYLE